MHAQAPATTMTIDLNELKRILRVEIGRRAGPLKDGCFRLQVGEIYFEGTLAEYMALFPDTTTKSDANDPQLMAER